MRISIVFLWILTGIVTGVVASDKGHGFGSWAFAGLLLGPLGLLAAVGLSDQKLREYIRRTIDPQSIHPIQNSQNILDRSSFYSEAKPKLLNESKFAYQSKDRLKEKYIGDFLLNKSASEDQLWNKIVEMFEFFRPGLVDIADRTKSNSNLSSSGGMAYIICSSDGQKLALAYAKDSSDESSFYWQIRMY